jgi:hypothetical protein
MADRNETAGSSPIPRVDEKRPPSMRIHSRGARRPGHAKRTAPENRGRRESRMPKRTRSLVCKVKSIRVGHHRFAGTPGLPCAMVLTVSFVLAPVTGLSCHRRLQDHRLANLISASGYQAHTTSPSACARIRPSGAKASTASRPTFVTMANAPLIGRDGRICRRDLPDGLSEIFLERGLDMQSEARGVICPSGKSAPV